MSLKKEIIKYEVRIEIIHDPSDKEKRKEAIRCAKECIGGAIWGGGYSAQIKSSKRITK